jgi:hypothetical protein
LSFTLFPNLIVGELEKPISSQRDTVCIRSPGQSEQEFSFCHMRVQLALLVVLIVAMGAHGLLVDKSFHASAFASPFIEFAEFGFRDKGNYNLTIDITWGTVCRLVTRVLPSRVTTIAQCNYLSANKTNSNRYVFTGVDNFSHSKPSTTDPLQ